jgi:tRNA-splicing ligase RtcB
MSKFSVIDAGNGRFIKAWKDGVKFEDKAVEQLKNTATLPFVFRHISALPDCHWGMGSTVGTVLPTKGAVVPAAVGVDIGCGMMAARINVRREDLGDLHQVRLAIEKTVPAGRTNNGAVGDRGAWYHVPEAIQTIWDTEFAQRYADLITKHPGAKAHNTTSHLGTLGTGNHFIELAEDEHNGVWIVLHSGSRGMGNKIGQYFTNIAKAMCEAMFIKLPDPDLAYLPESSQEFKDYRNAVTLAQDFALRNRQIMADNILKVLGAEALETVQCHHNYIAWENHYGENVIVTRKGAVRARVGDMGIIPGSMGTRTYIVRGLGNPDSFCTCSHGAGRAMSRTQAEKVFTIEDHIKATEGVECLKDASVLDETPGAYKDINAVMAAQDDLVEIVHTLKQFVNVKGTSDKKSR